MPNGNTQTCLDREASELLPWLANNTLDADESGRVRAHIAECDICRDELQGLSEVQKRLRSGPALDVISGPPLASLMQRIDAYENQNRLQESVIEPLRLWRRSFFRPFTELRPTVRWLLGVQTALVAVLFAIMLTPKIDPGARFHTASREASSTLTTSNDVRIVLDTTMTMEEFRAILAGVDGQIVAGPSVWGVYTVSIGSAANVADDQLRATRFLRSQPGVIFVEPVVIPRP